MANDPLRRAQRDFLHGRYDRVISGLEPLSLTYRESHLFYYLIGSSCLYTGDIGGASTYLRRAEQLNFRHTETLAALAAVHVRRGETDKAVQLYLEMLERSPDNKFAQRALSFLRSNSDPAKISELTNSGNISVLYPKPSVGLRNLARIAVILMLTAVAALGAGYGIPRAFKAYRDSRPVRNGVDTVNLTDQERKNPVTLEGNFDYVLTEKEALKSFERAKDLFRTWHDEAALVEINRILSSNAAASIKSKAETLRSFVRDPDFTSVKDLYSYGDVLRSPGLFDGVAVIWKGSAANISNEETGPTFDLLVGYQNKKKLEGIVPVKIAFPLRINPGVPLELLGRIRHSGGSFWIEGLSIHELTAGTP